MNLYDSLSWNISTVLRYCPCVTKGSHSFTCHPHSKHYTIGLPAINHRHKASPPFGCMVQTTTGWPKNGTVFWDALTSSNINLFSKLFHCQNQAKICNSIITKDPTTPQVCRYTILWNVKCLKSNNLMKLRRTKKTVQFFGPPGKSFCMCSTTHIGPYWPNMKVTSKRDVVEHMQNDLVVCTMA